MAKVLSSISGNLISAASAGYAPTNSGDVSAIASAYQVVSATGTQLYAGTAHVTSINSAPISASRAGNAANAGMANSAYYDGTGRLISSLPDSATVSSIASSYAPTFGLNAGKISSINGSALDTPTGSQVVTATGSSWIGGEIGISSINGSALSAKEAYSASRATYDDFGDNIRATYAKQSAFSGVSATVANNSASWGQGGSVSSPFGTIFVSGDTIEGTNSAVLTASSEEGFTTSFATEGFIPSWQVGNLYTGTLPGSGATLYIPTTGPWGSTAIISGRDSNMAIVTASGLASEDPITIYLGAIVSQISASANNYINIAGDVTAEKTGGITVTGIGELAWASSVSGVVNTVSSNSASWGQGGVDSATVSSIASSYAQSAVSGVESTVSANSASWGGGATGDYVEKSALEVTIGTANTASRTAFVQGSSNSASGASFAQGRLNTADTNSFAQGYNNSSVFYSFVQGSQNKALYTSFAQGNANIASAISFACGNGVWAINTAAAFGRYNLSYDGDTATGHSAAFVIGDGPMYDQRHDLMKVTKDGEITMYSSTADTVGTGIMSSIRAVSAGVSSKADSSALSSYALSADVSGTVDVVSSQSANWGGSALALSAGPGVSLTKSGNTLIAGLDETVLFSGGGQNTKSAALPESISNFAWLKVRVDDDHYGGRWVTVDTTAPWCKWLTNYGYDEWNTGSDAFGIRELGFSAGGTAIKSITGWQKNMPRGGSAWQTAFQTGAYGGIVKVIGVNRTAGA